MSHADQVTKLPKNFKIIAQSINSKMCIIENEEKKMFGIQFHPEVSHTIKGKLILKNFIFSICKLTKNWSSRDQKKKLINEVRNSVGHSKVICALSGGVDSTFSLLKACEHGLRPLAVHMDNGWNSELAQHNISNLII